MVSTQQSYPAISAKAWRTLRAKFLQAVPTRVTPSYLATVLGTRENSAKANVLPGLGAVGLIDGNGTPTPLAHEWRDDERYAAVCKEILEAIYPPDLREAVPDPANSRAAAESWFMRATGQGKSAVVKMVSFYTLLTTADPSQAPKPKASKSTKTGRGRSNGKRSVRGVSRPEITAGGPSLAPLPEMPEVRLNLEIRIDASVTPEQIDQIFESMAKHIYRRGDENQ